MRELEYKLSVHGPFELPDLADIPGVSGVVDRGSLNLRATYYDTADLRLARNGVTLRYRSGQNDGARWTLKLPDDSAPAAREELDFGGGAGSIPRGAADLVTAVVRSAPLTPAARIHTKRAVRELCSEEGSALAELVDDEVSVVDGSRVVARFRELEIEDRGGGEALLEAVAERLRASGALRSDPIPKVVRALGSRATAAPDVAVPAKIKPSRPAGDAVRAALAAGTHRMIVNDARVRLGYEDSVHQMRVGARRMRSDLRTFGPLVDEAWADSINQELKWIADALGEVRDLDVMQARLRKAGGGMEEPLDPLLSSMDARHDAARTALLAALRGPRYVELLERLVLATSSPALTDEARNPCIETLPPLVAQAWRRLARRARSLRPGDPDSDFHRVRILAKRARYAAEAVAPSLGAKYGKRAEGFAARCADVQDVLGALQDAVVSVGMVRHIATEHTDNGPFNLALGRLLERQEHSKRESKQAFPKVWDKLDRPKNLRWLEG